MAITSSARVSRTLVVVCSCILAILVVAALSLARAVLIPVALATMLTFVLAPFATRLQRIGLGRVPAVLVVTTAAFLIVAGFGAVVVRQAHSLASELPEYRDNIRQKLTALHGGENGFWADVENAANELQEAIFGAREQTMMVQVKPSGTAQFEAVAGPVVEFLAHVVLVVFLVVFMLVKREDLRNRVIRLLGHGHVTETTHALDDASQRISRFLLMQVAINTSFGLSIALGLFTIGVPHAFLWGLLAGGLRFLPYVGTPVAAVLLLLVSVAVFPNWTQPVLLGLLFAVLEVLAANVLEPLLFGHSTGLSPVALLVAAVFWAWLWGPIGLLLSTPLTVCLVVMGQYVSGLEFFNVMLGDEPALAPPVRFYQRLLARDPDEAFDLVEEEARSKPSEQIYDEMLLPALALANRDRENEALPPEDARDLFRELRRIIEDVPAQTCTTAEEGGDAGGNGKVRGVVLGCPAENDADEMILEMLRQLIEPCEVRLEVLSAEALASEVLQRVGEEEPAVVCIATLSPNGLSSVRYLCKRLRAQFPELKIVVSRLGRIENAEKTRQRLLAAGADVVATSLLETRSQLLPLVQAAALSRPRPVKTSSQTAGQH
ncbi:MAG: AI-2E family transporter [Planctomycetes bacterium]|nr:AI-2E family transporter [Planctomycetota bacterium]